MAAGPSPPPPSDPLSSEESEQVQQALRITDDLPIIDALRIMLECTLPESLRIAQQRLLQRGNLFSELQSAMYGTEPQARLLALQLISRMPQVPRELRGGAIHAVQCTLTLDPLSDEVLVALMALYSISAHAQHFQPEVKRICAHVESLDSERAQLIKRIANAVLASMERTAAAYTERFHADRDRLIALVQDAQLDAARALLVQIYPEDNPEDPDGGMTGRVALCEAAAQSLKGKSPSSTIYDLLELALGYAQIFASWSSSGGEGMGRMVKVNELRRRLKHLA